MSDGNSLFQGIGTAMRYLSDRQRVISQNIANADTAGYKARDVAAPSFAGMVDEVTGVSSGIAAPQVQMSDTMRALGAKQPLGGGNVIMDQDVVETKPDGNNITLEEQVMKLGSVQAEFSALTSIYGKQMQMLRTATRGSGG